MKHAPLFDLPASVSPIHGTAHATRLDDVEEIHRLPHTVTITDLRPGLAASIAAHRRWIEDPLNGTRGVYGVHYDTYGRSMIAFFSDAFTAFWFRVRWGGQG